jgi:hypothetical protein
MKDGSLADVLLSKTEIDTTQLKESEGYSFSANTKRKIFVLLDKFEALKNYTEELSFSISLSLEFSSLDELKKFANKLPANFKKYEHEQ